MRKLQDASDTWWAASSTCLWLYEEIKGLPQPWRVRSVHTHACNLERADGKIATLVSPRYGNGPFHIVVPATVFAQIQPDELVHIGNGQIRLPAGTIDAHRVLLWHPRLPAPTLTPASDRLTRSPLFWLYEEIKRAHSPLLSPQITTYQQQVEMALAALQAGWRTGDLHLITAGARRLAGLGPGLTPAGDDLLVGWLAGIFFYGERGNLGVRGAAVGQAVAATAAARTTRLSAAWLRHAGMGEFAEPWHQLAAGLETGDPAVMAQATHCILNTGATSGQEAMKGFLYARRLFDTPDPSGQVQNEPKSYSVVAAQ